MRSRAAASSWAMWLAASSAWAQTSEREIQPRSEVTSNLKAAYTSERAYWQGKDTFSPDTLQIGFSPELGNRYSYYFAPKGTAARRTKKSRSQRPQAGAVIIGFDEMAFPNEKFFDKLDDTGCPVTHGDVGGRYLGVGIIPGADGGFLIYAAGNTDADASLDCWSVASVPRLAANGSAIPAGEPFHEQSDSDPTSEMVVAEFEECQIRANELRELVTATSVRRQKTLTPKEVQDAVFEGCALQIAAQEARRYGFDKVPSVRAKIDGALANAFEDWAKGRRPDLDAWLVGTRDGSERDRFARPFNVVRSSLRFTVSETELARVAGLTSEAAPILSSDELSDVAKVEQRSRLLLLEGDIPSDARDTARAFAFWIRSGRGDRLKAHARPEDDILEFWRGWADLSELSFRASWDARQRNLTLQDAKTGMASCIVREEQGRWTIGGCLVNDGQ